MTPERFEIIEQLYHAVLSVPPEEKAEFLLAACGDDKELHNSVEALVLWHEAPGDFMQKEALQRYVDICASDLYPLVGQEVGTYKITSLIEEGGMGEVYAAFDTRLRRRVAIKTFRQLQAIDPDRAARLWHEARAASAIVHPNVAQIFAVHEDEQRSFIVMEYLDGDTLRRRLAQGVLPLISCLRIATQIASALVAAHKAGVVHRDIKPENVILIGDEHVKVLDFGLAKRIETITAESDATASESFKTSPGIILGTLPYMSPEQTRGGLVDARTDLWSLGVTLFEMVTGEVPFAGRTAPDIFAAILERHPPRLNEQRAGVPQELQRIMDKALAKEVKERHQSATELYADLRSLSENLTFELKARSASTRNRIFPEVKSEVRFQPQTQSFKSKKWRALYLLPLVIVALAFGFVLWRKFATSPRAHFLPGNFEVRNFSENGRVMDAAISADARFVVYVTDEGGKRSLWMKQVATADTISLPQLVEGSYSGLTVSRDANYIYYSLFRDAPHGQLYRVSIPAASESRKLMDDVDPPISLSPDGGRFAFIREYHERQNELIVADADGTNARTLVADSRLTPGGVSWSPREEIVACSVRVAEDEQDYRSIVGFRVADSKQVRITDYRWKKVDRIVWLEDMSGLVLVAADERSRLSQIWHVSYPSGDVRRVTTDLGEYRTLSLTNDSSTLATVQSMRSSRIWVGALSEPWSSHVAVSSGKDEGFYGLTWAPSERLIYTSPSGGSRSLWIMNSDGSVQQQLTFDGRADRQPVVTPDGKYVLFVSDRDGAAKIWRINIDGSNPVPLTNGPDDSFPTVSLDSSSVIYASRNNDLRSLWRVPVGGGQPTRLTAYLSNWPSISPDSKYIACLYRENSGTADVKLAVVPVAGGRPLRIFDLPSGIAQPPDLISPGFRWSRDSRSVLYVITSDGASNIWSQPIDGGKPGPITTFTSDRIFWFDLSRDGALVYARGQYTHDVVLITDPHSPR